MEQLVAAWPLAGSLAFAVAVGGLREGRRRTSLNEALHELRRPLQALALASPRFAGPGHLAIEPSLRMAATALERLEREINGDVAAAARTRLAAQPLLATAVGRWRARAALAGGSLSLRWRAGSVAVEGDRHDLSQALDNLVVNAIEHGGPTVTVGGRAEAGRLIVEVVDSGRGSRSASRRESPAETIARLSGRRRRGHGLRVVRRVAAGHGGRFALRCTEAGTVATLELPLAEDGPRR